MAPSPEETPDRSELSKAKARRLINFNKTNTGKDVPDNLLARGIERRIQDGQPNQEESQLLKQVPYYITSIHKKATRLKKECESFLPQQTEELEEVETQKMLNDKAHEKLNFVIEYLKQGQNPHMAILELNNCFKDRHPLEQKAILINDLFARTQLAMKEEATKIKPFKDPNEVTVEAAEDTPAPPSSPNLKPKDFPPEIINPPKPSQMVPEKSQKPSVESDQAKQPEVKEKAMNKPMETEIFNLFQTAICESWEPMDVSFTPEEVYASALKKFQDNNAPALPIPALVNVMPNLICHQISNIECIYKTNI
ncbi:hypothetical protein DSO57_1008763 [Entomophthora muscae]|uniref:Uncharacterized protein n=1 Tax=Entomophthora muscae TaxID=34485 RepID=A0ACC2UFZ1_9FUNG|nr:hypothetical protein DSO57_1008763 [Entomophthora muscae]